MTKYNDVPFVPCNDCSNWESCTEEAYEQGRADERERIVGALEEELKEETLGDGKSVSDVGIGLEIALKIVRGGEKEKSNE